VRVKEANQAKYKKDERLTAGQESEPFHYKGRDGPVYRTERGPPVRAAGFKAGLDPELERRSPCNDDAVVPADAKAEDDRLLQGREGLPQVSLPDCGTPDPYLRYLGGLDFGLPHYLDGQVQGPPQRLQPLLPPQATVHQAWTQLIIKFYIIICYIITQI
jgi:hypothetical protein